MTPVEALSLTCSLHHSEVKRLLLAATRVFDLEMELDDTRKIASIAARDVYALATSIGNDPDAPYLPNERGSGSAARINLNFAAAYADFMTAYADRLTANLIAAKCDMRILEIQLIASGRLTTHKGKLP